MNIVITGSRGLLGSNLKKLLISKGLTVIEGDRPQYNISSYESMKKLLNPSIDILFNCAAYTDVLKAEEDKKNAYLTNAQSVGILAKVCLEYNIRLVHFSTDFVFNGKIKTSYQELDVVDPLNYYGLSKLHGERVIQKKMKANPNYTIFRVQWLYGDSSKTFFSKILDIAKKEKTLNIVIDEIGSPCSVTFISNILYQLFFIKNLKKLKGNIFHLTHNDSCSRYTCGKYFLEKMGYEGKVLPAKTSIGDLERPKRVILDNSYLKNISKVRMGTWKKDLDEYISEIS